MCLPSPPKVWVHPEQKHYRLVYVGVSMPVRGAQSIKREREWDCSAHWWHPPGQQEGKKNTITLQEAASNSKESNRSRFLGKDLGGHADLKSIDRNRNQQWPRAQAAPSATLWKVPTSCEALPFEWLVRVNARVPDQFHSGWPGSQSGASTARAASCGAINHVIQRVAELLRRWRIYDKTRSEVKNRCSA